MELKCTALGPIGANCYRIKDSNQLCLIDPGEGEDYFLKEVKEENITHILLTHGHYDHTGAVKKLKEMHPEAKVYIHQGDAVKNPSSPLFPLAGEVEDLNLLQDGQVIPFGSLEIKVIATPGHSKGSVCFQVENHLFTGDTLFAGSMGRVDLEGGDYNIIMKSLLSLSKMDKTLQVHPGHENSSTLERELKSNPYMQEAMSRA